MILIDTNVVSELMRPLSNSKVLDWFDRQDSDALFLSTITEGELWAGFHHLPPGKRRVAIGDDINGIIESDFDGRLIDFGSAAAKRYGLISGLRKQLGRPISTADAQIAAVALVSGMQLATRNVADFEHCGLDLIDPWA